ncbi:MAG: hypothetical protein LBC27_00415 [Spirochaetaceae bacterium]|jgi:hypothetical protein|nr:hypothetical protein [Spirochaetaceae bacterium]
MTIVEIKDMVRKDVPIYYRRVYTGNAVVEIAGKKENMRTDWTIETTPLGTKETTIVLADKIDYPLLPLIKELKKKIEYLDSEGKLPL